MIVSKMRNRQETPSIINPQTFGTVLQQQFSQMSNSDNAQRVKFQQMFYQYLKNQQKLIDNLEM